MKHLQKRRKCLQICLIFKLLLIIELVIVKTLSVVYGYMDWLAVLTLGNQNLCFISRNNFKISFCVNYAGLELLTWIFVLFTSQRLKIDVPANIEMANSYTRAYPTLPE